MAGHFRGSIKSWNPDKGWGFIECAQTQAVYSKDIFLRKPALLGGLERVNKGDQVEFSVTDNGRGPEAAACQCVNLQGWGVPVPPQAPAAGSMVGLVKSWNPVKGWGHIASDQITKMFNKDVFVMRSQVVGGDLQKGQQVRFNVTHGMKGIEAANVQVVGVAQQPQQLGYGQLQPGGFGQAQYNQHRPSATPSYPSAQAAAAVPTGKQHFGTVKSFNAEKGWGHIDCQQTRLVYGKDMFFLQSALAGGTVEVNDYVTFNLEQGLKGPQAANVKVISGGVGGVNVGAIKQWNGEKNYGFIQCDALRQIYQRDIFLHGKEVQGHVPSIGQEVSFTVEIAADGRPEAVGVTFTQSAIPGMRSQPY